jgi:sugar O-acyltransferase (sialic acid O-acetyltransferase NeuD family)
MNSPLYAIYGASGCGRGIMPLARLQLRATGIDPERLVFVDDGFAGQSINGHVVHSYKDFLTQTASERHVAIAIADSNIRQRLAKQCASDRVLPWSVRAESVVIMDDVVIGEGALLSPYVALTSNIRIGQHFHANLYSYVEHDCSIGDFVTFAPGAKCNGNVVIDDHAYIGAGAILRQGKPGSPRHIGRGAVVGMGAVVLEDVPDNAVVAGNPAKVIRMADEHE